MRYYVEINGNSSLDIEGLAIKELPPITKPLIRTQIEEIDGRDGDIVTELGYSAYDKSIEIGLYGSFDIDAIIKYFTGEGTITFSNEPDKFYYFKILNQIDYEKLLKFKTAVVTFHCQPFKYPVEETPIEGEAITITGSGSNITLENTVVAPMEMKVKGNTIQDGTPTPSSPIPVQVVSGDNSINVCGKNILNGANPSEFNSATSTFSNNVITVSSTNTSTLPQARWVIDNLQANDVIRYSAIIQNSNGQIVMQYYNNNTWNTLSANTSTYTDGITPATKAYTNTNAYQKLRILLYSSNTVPTGASESNYKNVIVTKNNSDMTYEEYKGASYPISLSSKNLVYTGWLSDYITRVNDSTKAKIDLVDNRICLFFTASAGYNEYDTKYMFKTNWKTNTQYTFSFDMKSTANAGNIAIAYTDGTTQTFNSLVTSNTWSKAVMTSNANKTIKYLRANWTSGSSYIDINTFMINEGTSALPYEEYTTPIELCKIGTYQDKIDKSTGINKLAPTEDFTETKNGLTFTGHNGVYTISGTASAGTFSTAYNVANYTIQTGDYLHIKNSIALSGAEIDITFTDNTVATPGLSVANRIWSLSNYVGKTIKQINFYVSNGLTTNFYLTPMILNTSTATDFEPYGTGWYLKKEIGKVVLNGSENWTNPASGGVYQYNTSFLSIALSTAYCTHAKQKLINSNIVSSIGNNEFVLQTPSGSTNSILYFRDDNITGNITNWKSWLSSNNVSVYYILATPTYETITDTNLIGQLEALKPYSYNPTTNITQTNNDAPFELDVSLSYTNTMNVNNVGNIYAKPILTIEGSGTIGIILNDIEVLSVDLGTDEKITIDVPNLQAYNPDDNVLLNRNVTGDYMKLLINDGDNTIAFSGSVTSATLTNYTRWI